MTVIMKCVPDKTRNIFTAIHVFTSVFIPSLVIILNVNSHLNFSLMYCLFNLLDCKRND